MAADYRRLRSTARCSGKGPEQGVPDSRQGSAGPLKLLRPPSGSTAPAHLPGATAIPPRKDLTVILQRHVPPGKRPALPGAQPQDSGPAGAAGGSGLSGTGLCPRASPGTHPPRLPHFRAISGFRRSRGPSHLPTWEPSFSSCPPRTLRVHGRGWRPGCGWGPGARGRAAGWGARGAGGSATRSARGRCSAPGSPGGAGGGGRGGRRGAGPERARDARRRPMGRAPEAEPPASLRCARGVT